MSKNSSGCRALALQGVVTCPGTWVTTSLVPTGGFVCVPAWARVRSAPGYRSSTPDEPNLRTQTRRT